ncbi:MAG: hypothetical protein L0H64_08660, partial [Pseudonocardia sp.]|nr:hypothetical protein [Pseudonocardia sp.]
MITLLVVLGAAVGAPLRYAVDRMVAARHGTGLPWGTFVVNVAGSFVLGGGGGGPPGRGGGAGGGAGGGGAPPPPHPPPPAGGGGGGGGPPPP